MLQQTLIRKPPGAAQQLLSDSSLLAVCWRHEKPILKAEGSPGTERCLLVVLTSQSYSFMHQLSCFCVQHSDSRTKATAHSGILRAAKGVVDDLVHEGVLAALMEGKPVPPTNRKTQDCRCMRQLLSALGCLLMSKNANAGGHQHLSAAS